MNSHFAQYPTNPKLTPYDLGSTAIRFFQLLPCILSHFYLQTVRVKTLGNFNYTSQFKYCIEIFLFNLCVDNER